MFYIPLVYIHLKSTHCSKTSLELSLVFSLFCLNTRLVGATTPLASSCSNDTSVAACSVLNSFTISYLFGCLFPARRLVLLCHPTTWLFVHGPSSLYIVLYFGICTSYDVSGCDGICTSYDVSGLPPKLLTKACKTLVNQNLIKCCKQK